MIVLMIVLMITLIYRHIYHLGTIQLPIAKEDPKTRTNSKQVLSQDRSEHAEMTTYARSYLPIVDIISQRPQVTCL
jgi:hypothetical protein